ncbi:DUF2336 domain-containing protein [Niveispirillum sp. KHB5.9]|uniref:DUF2336 domain-containing protein n=1 Tax=Niveispirillum sp. KHB5.9 TaxID=3400269 RepID=UPI003A8688A4
MMMPPNTGDPEGPLRPILRSRLNSSDVDRLLHQPGTRPRIDTMTKLVMEMEEGDLTDAEKRLALDILRAFAADAETEVRAAVAWQIHNSPILTGEMAEKLARDVAQVAVPILKYFDGLPEKLLLEVVAERDPQKQLAIAGRRTVSAAVSAALVETGNVVTVVHLLRNKGAAVREATLNRAAERFGQFRIVADSVAARPEVTMAVVERMIALVSEDVRQQLIRDHNIEPALAKRLAEGGREAATLRVLQPLLLSRDDAEMVAKHLYRQGRLTPQVLFRALCAGDLELFVAGMAARANITPQAAGILAWDDGILGLHCLMEAANIPGPLTAPFRTAQQVALETDYASGECTRERFQQAVLEVLFDKFADTAEREIDELLMQISDQPGIDIGAALNPMRA